MVVQSRFHAIPVAGWHLPHRVTVLSPDGAGYCRGISSNPDSALHRPRHGETQGGLRSIAKNTTYLTLAKGVTLVARVLYAALVARVLGDELYGVFNYGMSFGLAVLPLATLGMNTLLGRDFVRAGSRGGELLGQLLLLRLAASVVIAGASAALALALEGTGEVALLLCIFCSAIAFRSIATWSKEVFTAAEATHHDLRQDLVFRLVDVIAGCALLFGGAGLLALATLHAALWLVQAVFGVLTVHWRVQRIRPVMTLRPLAALVREGMPLALLGLAETWLVHGVVVLGRWLQLPAAALSQVALVLQVTTLATLPLLLASEAALPVLSRALTSNGDASRTYLGASLRLTGIVGGLVVLGATTLGPWLTPFLFGRAFAPAGALLATGILLLLPMCANGFLFRLLVARAEGGMAAACLVGGALLMTALLPTLIAADGARGALTAALLGGASSTLALLVWCHRAVPIQLGRLVAGPCIALALALAVAHGLKQCPGWLGLIAATVTLATVLRILRVVTGDEWAALQAAWRSKSR